jgi:hypothetical protein
MRVTLTLTDDQVSQVTHELSSAASLGALLADVNDPQRLGRVMAQFSDDRNCSRSTLRALAVLGAFSENVGGRDLKKVAEELGLSASTTYRYVNTWVMLGMLEKDSASRRYRRPDAPEGSRV